MGQPGNRKQHEPDTKIRRLQRRVNLLERAGMLSDHQPITIQVATSFKDLDAAHRLVHDAYVQSSYILPKEGLKRGWVYDDLPQTTTFVAKAPDDTVVGVIGLIEDTDEFRLPADGPFETELNALRQSQHVIGEVTNLAILPAYRASNTFLALTRRLYAYAAQDTPLDTLFIAVSTGHAEFFSSVLAFKLNGFPRDYGGDTFDMVQGLELDIRTFGDRMKETDAQLGESSFLFDYYFTNNLDFKDAD